ncbi:MAG: hypothetical protein DRP51_06085 [Candidatus Zixiibacteriota bacterium]|nr:MAG: hypothetical protein DRP51_06085 [candidate division Zixibacteria bacterium]
MESDLEKFQAVCPHCSAIFDLDESVIKKGWDDIKAEEYLKIQCPECEGIKLIDIIFDWEN